MSNFSSLFSWGAFILPNIINGPVAAVLYYQIAKSQKHSPLLRFWFILLLLHCLGLLLIIETLGYTWQAAGCWSLAILPISAAISLLILLSLRSQLWQLLEHDKYWQKLYILGMIAIPLLQLIIATITSTLVNPIMCGMSD